MSALQLVVVIAGVASALAWILSLFTRDTSWVDRLWSLLPETYVWIFAAHAGLRDARLDLMAVLTTLWGARLTFNFARKGGYRGVEDYRWAELRSRMSPALFQVFNLVFIVLIQNALLVAISLPALAAAEHPSAPHPLDIALAVAFFACLFGETLADEQQWRFQRSKAAAVQSGNTSARGFLDTGLFRFSRHPNYFFELAQWWLVFAFGASAAGLHALPSGLGPLLLSALFVGSTRFTEQISAAKYSDYVDYQRRTSPIIPWFTRDVADAPRTAPIAE